MKNYDVAVIGGGITGVAAAVSAARLGVNVILIEKDGALGGAMNNSLVYPFMRYFTKIDGKLRALSAGIFTEMRERHRKYAYDKKTDLYQFFSPEHFKFTLDEMVTEAGVDVLFHAKLCEVSSEQKTVKSVKLATVSGLVEVTAKIFIDCTGDGQLLYLAGCDYQLGRLSDGYCQPMTTCFRMSGVDIKQFLKERPALQELYRKKQQDGEIKNPRENILTFEDIGEGILHLNTTRVIKLDPTDPLQLSKAEIEARRQIAEMENFLKQNCTAFANSTVISVAARIGVRESRKLKGEHILTVDELKNLTMFPDRIALGNYDVDIHNPSGTGTSHYYFEDGEYYSIPYRCLLPKEYENMLVSGRCLSATHEAQASVRILPIVATLGEAAGVAAATCVKTDRNTKEVDVSAIQDILRKNNAAID